MSMAQVTIAQASFVEFVLPDRFQIDRRMWLGLSPGGNEEWRL